MNAYKEKILNLHATNVQDQSMNKAMMAFTNALNPINPDVWNSYEILGGEGAKLHPLEINKGAPWELMLLKAFWKPIKVMIT